MSVEKQESGICVGCPLDASQKTSREVIAKHEKLYGEDSKNVVLGALAVEEAVIRSLVKQIECQGPKVNQHNQHVCSLASAFNGATDIVGGPNGRVKSLMRFESLVEEKSDEDGSGLYL